MKPLFLVRQSPESSVESEQRWVNLPEALPLGKEAAEVSLLYPPAITEEPAPP